LCKKNNKKYYLALNIFAHNEDIRELETILPKLKKLDIDAFIVSDPGFIQILRQQIPEVQIHLSTQSNVLNYESVRFWKEQGVSRIILARELSKTELVMIRKENPETELEMFVHGAMCMAYSGRCNLSLYLLGRDANKGNCAHVCRWKYELLKNNSNQEILMEEQDRGVYILNSKDLNLAARIPEIISMGIDSLKIEGRNKTSYYIASITRVYRNIIDKTWKKIKDTKVRKTYLDELNKVSHREYTTGFFSSSDKDLFNFKSSEYIKDYKMVGMIESYEKHQLVINVRDEIKCGDEIEIIFPDIIDDQVIEIKKILNTSTGKELKAAHNGYRIMVPVNNKAGLIHNLIIRKKNE
ncbi:MAG: U32 family peptidase C-terminal domain-containing protein, partial [Candidatus Margulisbacteria bacterium]|nr:U32 family peptidase C-terminal domain-containing protein [Candidatus Margulisiibacteriota bacterium]